MQHGSEILIKGAEIFAKRYNGNGATVTVHRDQLIHGTNHIADICIEITESQGLLQNKKYYFDYTNLEFIYRSPEFINTIINKCFNIDLGNPVLSSKYRTNKYITTKRDKFIPESRRVQLTDTLINVCTKIASLKLEGIKLDLISDDGVESIDQRFEHAIFTGRCDRILDGKNARCTDCSVYRGSIDTAYDILEENGSTIKIRKVYVSGEFVSYTIVDNKSLPVRIKEGRYIYVVD